MRGVFLLGGNHEELVDYHGECSQRDAFRFQQLIQLFYIHHVVVEAL